MLAYHFTIYPRVRPILREALLATARDGPFHEDLQNLMDMYEVYLPTVRKSIRNAIKLKQMGMQAY